MTRDHFKQFMLPPGQAQGLGSFGTTNTPVTTYLKWIIALGGTSYASWKLSKWHSSYEQDQHRTVKKARKKVSVES